MPAVRTLRTRHLNGRIIHFRQCGDRQLCIANQTDQEDGSHQQSRGDRSQDKRTRWIHCALAETGLFEMTTVALSCNLSKLLLATTSPGLMPSTCVTPPFVTPGFMLRICAILFWITYTNDAWPFC